MEEIKREISLKEKVREDIYFDFREILIRRSIMDNCPSPPNIKEFKSSIINFYSNIKYKLEVAINKKGLNKFSYIMDNLENVYSPNDLDIKIARKLVFKFNEFLDEIGITEIWD